MIFVQINSKLAITIQRSLQPIAAQICLQLQFILTGNPQPCHLHHLYEYTVLFTFPLASSVISHILSILYSFIGRNCQILKVPATNRFPLGIELNMSEKDIANKNNYLEQDKHMDQQHIQINTIEVSQLKIRLVSPRD